MHPGATVPLPIPVRRPNQMSERTWQDKVATWSEQGFSASEIVHKCLQIGKRLSKSRVLRLLKKKIVVEKKRYTPSTIVDKEKIDPIFKYVFDVYREDSQKDSDDVVKEIADQFGEKLTPNIVKRIREAQGLGTDGVRYGHSVRLANRAPRVAFCTHHLSVGTMFTHHVFTDESMVQSGRRGRLCYVLKGDIERRVKPRFKHPPQLMIWGGISWEGATSLVILRKDVRVDGGVYQKMIHDVYLKFAEKKYGGCGNVALVQDNAKCHTSQSTLAFFQRSGVQKQMKKVIERQGYPTIVKVNDQHNNYK
ncbi:hypothetical protein PRIPAC_73704 [Pristionchus pacificus]|uniref:Uncharacterized protein n=1 Tax=Pristionchus pacificus TaxID=54126 RepID=A0A2A6C8E8_PRIPA|nr:hypothetical protein PRIPAC_73704 [Pristionchus pacificus]|eukprot:PDM74323.1 hypothetical protein PRIPAC_41679 [Pristionchus pacificus]